MPSRLLTIRRFILTRSTLAAVLILVPHAALGQPSSGEFFPSAPAAAPFDPSSASAAAGEASADRAAPSAAFAGLAERVQADLLLGLATTRIPIEVAPGRKGMSPQLALTYASRSGNGLVGRGWDLRLPCVKRSTRDGVPIDWSDDAYPYVDDAFTLVMPSGTVPLDRVLGTSGGNVLYASDAEEAMLRVWFTPAANTWTVTDKSGVRYEFGSGPAQNRVGPSVGSAAGTFAWGLTKVVDPSGNSIAYSYAAHGLNGAANAALYPARIDYGANAGAGYSDIFHVCFAYDSGGSDCTAAPALRPDPFVSYSGAFAAWTRHRITGIKQWTDDETAEATPTRRYAWTYAQDATSGESRLDRVEVFAGVETLRPTTFTYNASARQIATSATHQNFASGHARTQLPLRRNSISAGTRSDLIDMNGDGRPDWVECNNQNATQWFIYPNLGNGSFGARQTWSGPQCAMHQYFAELLDVNGDALPDVVQQLFPPPHGTTRNWRVWYNTGSGFSSEQVFAVPPTDFDRSVTNYGLWMHPVGGNGGARDLTGDGLPDAIDPYCNCNSSGNPTFCPGEEGMCRVFLGTGAAFAAPGVLWAWPRIESAPGRTSYFESSTGKTPYTLQDMNGDGLPDLVMSRPPLDPRAGGAGYCRGGPNHEAPCSSDGQCGVGICTHPTAWGVYYNSGTGFEFESVCSGGANNGLTCSGGCPGGRCEDLPTYWAGPADSAGERMDVEQLCGHSDTPQAGWPPIGVQGALRDMNGDGLPDYVDSNVDCDNPTTGPGWRVFINTGTNFKQSHVTWAGTAGLLVQQWGAQDDATPGVPDPADVAVVIADTLDVDGDGIADHIEAVPSDLSRLYVRRGLGAIPGTLSKQENGLGGSIEVTYGLASAVDPLPGTAPKVCNGGSNDGSVCKWVTDCPSGTCDACTDCDHSPFPLTAVAQITTKSGLTGTGHTLTQSYKFLAPYYDWQEREFRGFRWAVEEDAARDRRTETEFVQPGTHPRQQSTWCGAPGQSCTALVLARFYKGKVRSTRVRALATAKLHADSSSTWEFGYLSDPRQAGQNSVLVRLGERTQRGYGSVGATSLSRRETFAYDAYNNLTESQRYDGAVLTSKTQTTFEYQAASWIVDRPTEVRQLDAGTTTLARRTATYNAQGNPVLERRDLDANPAGGTGTITVATYAYSGAAGSAGQSTSVTDARGNVTTLAYADTAADYSCDSRGLYPCKTTNHLGHAIRRSYALRFGTMTEERDANDARTKLEYDALGRLTKVFRGVYAGAIPGDVKAWREFSYYLGSAGSPATPTRIDVKIREEAHASGYRTEARFHDGLGRFLATKAEAIVTGAAANVVREAVGFDSAGRVAHQYPPYGGGMALTSYDPPSGVATSTVFDLLDRPTQVTAPDGNARTVVYDPAGVTDLRDENYVACNGMPGTIARASCPGQRTVEQRDALGRLLTVSIYEGATLDSQTINEYDALDRLTSTKLAADEDSKVTFTYDSFGRRIGLRDKNSGTWSYGYDHSGNLIYQDDPKTEQHLEWCVDALNRPTNKRSFTTDAFSGNACGSGGTVRTSFAYDSCTRGVGRLCEENSPGRQVLTRTYTARGLVGTESRSIDAAGPARSLTYSFNYDEADRLKNVQYPTSVSATNETLTYSYDAAGQLVAAATPGNTYLAGAQYDLFGRSTRLDLGGAGSGSTSELRTYFGASGAYRLQQLAVLRASTALQTWNYELPSSAGPGWDRAGNLLKIDDVTPSGQYPSLSDRDNEWTYTYDGLGRLTNANWAARAATASFDHDTLGNLTAGNFAFPGVLTTTAVTFTHDPDRPHQIDWSAPPGSGSAYAYESGGSAGDGNGGLTSRPATAGADAAKSVLYDVEGRVQRITVGGDQVESVYDDAGQRIARIVNGTDVTLFFGRFVEVRGATLTRHVFAGARRIAFSPIAAPPTLTLAALPDDHPEVRMARAEADAVWLSSLPGPGLDPGPLASAAGTAVLVVGTLVLVWIPTGRRRVGIVGVVRRGRVGALVALYVVSLPPWPERPTLAPLLPPVAAQCPEPTPSPATTVHADHLGSTTLLTNYGDGAVQQYYRYGAYGRMNVIKPDGTQAAAGTELTELTYTGQRWDAHARSYYYGARHYDPAIGRFLTIDPARQFANPYTYVGWRPTMLVDPTGRDAYTFALLTGNDLAESYQTYGMIPGGSTTHGSVGLDGDGNQQVSLALGPPDPGGPSITAILFGANASAEGPNMSLDPSPSGANILDGGGGVPSLSAGYVDANGTVSLVPLPGGFYYGVTLGYQASYGDARGDQALYLGIAASYGPSVGGSVTFAPGQQINEGLVVAASYVDAQGRAAQFGYGLGTATGRFGEIGPGRSSGAPISGSASVAIGTQTLAFFEFLAITGDPSVGRR